MNDVTSEPVCMLRIDGEMTIYRALELCTTLKGVFEGGGDLEIDLAGVTELDSAGVQLLLSARQTAQAAQRELRLVGHSPAVLEIFEVLGLAAHFGMPG
jgi:anti-sigma B factor antagonist